MKTVLEIGHCCAGVSQTFADTLNTAHLVWDDPPYGYRARHTIKVENPRRLSFMKKIEWFNQIKDIFSRYQILHFHTRTFLPGLLDTLLYDNEVWLHFHGSEIRNKTYHAVRNPEKIFVSTPDLLKSFPLGNARWIPNPADLSLLPYIGAQDHDGPLKIVHAPSDRETKGTSTVFHAVDLLRAQGHHVTLEIVTDQPHETVLERMQQADIVIDWINPSYGLYGMAGIEGMALGKPVLASINPLWYNHLYCPVVMAHSAFDIGRAISTLENYEYRKTIGERGRQYVEALHDAGKVTQALFEV
jgi:hypothetical protein